MVQFVPEDRQVEIREWLLNFAVLLRCMESSRKFDVPRLREFCKRLYKRTLNIG